MSKFVGKFRREAEYSDDYEFAKTFLNKKRHRGEHNEVRKKKSYAKKEDHYGTYEDYEWKIRYRK